MEDMYISLIYISLVFYVKCVQGKTNQNDWHYNRNILLNLKTSHIQIRII